MDASSTIAWRKEYNFKDHLGNTRLVFTDRNANGVVDITGTASTSDVLQETHYYAFGLAFEGAWLQNDAAARDNAYQYNGIEFSQDFNLNISFAVFRSYDASIGRWLQIDPKPSYNISSYLGMEGNPVRFTDPLGDTIRIRSGSGFLGLKRQSLTYVNGSLLNRDGSVYGGKVKGFLAGTVRALNQIRTGGPSGNKLVTELQSSSKTTSIIRGTNSYAQYDKGLKSSNVVRWSPGNTSGGPDVNGSSIRPSYIGLGHELGHSHDKISDGRIDYSPWYTPNGASKPVPKAEIYATHWENLIRSEHNLSLRNSYGTDGVTGAPEGEILTGNSYSKYFVFPSTIDIEGMTYGLEVPLKYGTDFFFGYQKK